jgi:L-lactate dehydrogenase complex protein LldF
MTNLARQKLREKYLAAGAGITGANFLIADKGGVCVTENEGNAIMSTAFPDIHIAIAGIEKVIPSFKDLALFWPHLAQHGTGQAIFFKQYYVYRSSQKKMSLTDRLICM